MYDKHKLEQKIKHGELSSFSIVGRIRPEIVETYMQGMGMNALLKELGIDAKTYEGEGKLIKFFMPIGNFESFHTKDSCCVSYSSDETISMDEYETILNELFIETSEYYEAFIGKEVFMKIISRDYLYFFKVTFDDILKMMPLKQVEIAKILKISPGTLTDYKAERSVPSLKVLSTLMYKFPLLPWTEYIRDIREKEEEEVIMNSSEEE